MIFLISILLSVMVAPQLLSPKAADLARSAGQPMSVQQSVVAPPVLTNQWSLQWNWQPGATSTTLMWGTNSGKYLWTKTVSNTAQSSLTVTGLVAGAHYYATAYSTATDGISSANAPEISWTAETSTLTNPPDLVPGRNWIYCVEGATNVTGPWVSATPWQPAVAPLQLFRLHFQRQ